MKASIYVFCIAVFLSLSFAGVSAEEAAKIPAAKKNGEELFKKNCVTCHPGGGNLINSRKTIDNKSLASRNITTPEHIVKIMRNPVPPMIRYDEKAMPEEDAKSIAEYVLATFK